MADSDGPLNPSPPPSDALGSSAPVASHATSRPEQIHHLAPGEPVDALLAFLGAAHHVMGQQFDYPAARRVLDEARQELGGADSSSALQSTAAAALAKLQSLAAACQVRVDRLHLSTREAVALLRPTAPLGIVREDGDGRLQWILLSDHRGRRVEVHSSEFGGESRWLRLGELAEFMGGDRDQRHDWMALQPLLPCQSPHAAGAHDDHHHGDHEHGPSPLARYVQLLRPERSDIGVLVVFAIVVGLLALSSPIAVESLVNTVAFGQFLQPVIVLAFILFVFLAFAAAMRAVQAYIAEIIQRRIFVRVAADLAQRLPRVRTDFWNKHYGPEMINRFFETMTVQKVTASLLLDGLALAIQTFVGMTVIAFYHPVLLGFDAFLLLLILGIIFILGRGAVGTSIEESRRKYATAAWLEELARHPVAFRSQGGLNFALEHADRCVTGYLHARSRHFRILMRQIVATLGLQVLASTVLLGLGGWLVIIGDLTLGQLVAAELIVSMIVASFAKVGKHLESYYDVMAAVDKLGHLFDMPIEDQDGVDLPWRSTGMTVALDEVATEPSLLGSLGVRHASLTVKAGERIALARGHVGLRSDLLSCIGGTQNPAYGHVELDGHDVRRLRPASVYTQTSLVREVEVFAGTIAENIHVGRAGVSEEDIRLALAATGLLEDVLDLPQGLATHVETEGRLFCRDQLARLMLARAVAARPRLLLVDGIFDSLPDERLRSVLRGVVEAAPNCTWIVSTGRRSVAEFFERQFEITRDGELREMPKRPDGSTTDAAPRPRRAQR